MGKITQQVIKEATKIASKEVRLPKCVRDGIVKIKSNMEKIPTAEELMQSKNGDDYTHWEEIHEMLIEFAKLHVEACKKDIINNVETCIGGDGSPLVSIVSIIKSYPLENIK